MNTMKAIVASVLLLLLQVPPVRAVCSAPQPRLVCAEYFASEVVVEAKLLRTRAVPDKEDSEFVDGYVHTLRVEKALRGQIATTFQIYEGNDSGRAGFYWKAGRSYLLFLWFSKPEDAWVLDGCGNSGLLVKSGAALNAIKAIQSDHSAVGLIQGVVSTNALSDVLPGVSIEVLRAGRQRYSSVTNSRGEFRFKVPSGQYSVGATQPNASFESYYMSYEKAHDLRVQPGGCVQVQLVREQQGNDRSPSATRNSK